MRTQTPNPTTPRRTLPLLLLCLLTLTLLPQNTRSQQLRNPWDAQIPTPNQTITSEYPSLVKGCNFLFLNNVGNYTILSKQATNITKISNELIVQGCTAYGSFVRFFILFMLPLFLVVCLVLRANLNDWVHVVEFCQELYLLHNMNIVREPCLAEFHLAFKPVFFIFGNRINVPRNTNYLARMFCHSCYFLENIGETAIIMTILVFLYLLLITAHLFVSNNPDSDLRFKRILKFVEFGTFIRMGQLMILPYCYYTIGALRVVSFDSGTRIFDYLISFIYSILLLGFIGFAVYTINYAPINLEARKTLNKYGALYAHVKYNKESKIISNEFCFRQMLKMIMAALHHFGYFSPLGICLAGIFGYGLFTLYILVTFWFNGLYRNLYFSFKMLVFHFIMMGNYIFAAANIERTTYEVFIVGFLNQLLNSLTILYLMTHMIVNLFFHLKNLRNKQEDDEYEELDRNVNLNVVFATKTRILLI